MAQKCWSNHNLFRSIIITGDHIKLQQLLKSSYFNPNSVDLKDRYGRTPLIFSVLGDHYECTEILLKVNSILRYLLFSFCIEKMAHNNFEEFNFQHFKFSILQIFNKIEDNLGSPCKEVAIEYNPSENNTKIFLKSFYTKNLLWF